MFSTDADLFFLSPLTGLTTPNDFGVLYLLRRDINLCMGGSCQALWPAAMGMLAGVDLLAKFLEGSDATGKVRDRFRSFVGRFFGLNPTDQEVLYQLRNALLHSFGLYSKTPQGKVYRFFLTDDPAAVGLVSQKPGKPPGKYYIDLRALHREFEKAVEAYRTALDSDSRLQANFAAMFVNYGRIHIG